MTFQPEKVDDFLKLFEEVGPKIRQVEGCESVKLLRETDGSNVLFTYSVWQGDAFLQAYRQSDLFKETWAKTKVLFSEKPEAWSTLKEDL